ncbi:hypothetical protein CTI12_AA618800 [Artemisia annua]|uniref:Uncharacterized protein n=1 Tax=Artemisia annua TaxID=35608 RepID=A0A2U1KCX5_ARTAN|nr:hypothetical protein CTI12_AA618800 [Artemisia annua]
MVSSDESMIKDLLLHGSSMSGIMKEKFRHVTPVLPQTKAASLDNIPFNIETTPEVIKGGCIRIVVQKIKGSKKLKNAEDCGAAQ